MDDFCFCNVIEWIFTSVNNQPWKLKYCCRVWLVPLIKNTVACCLRDLSQPHLFYQLMFIRWKEAAKCDICVLVCFKRYETCILIYESFDVWLIICAWLLLSITHLAPKIWIISIMCFRRQCFKGLTKCTTLTHLYI